MRAIYLICSDINRMVTYFIMFQKSFYKRYVPNNIGNDPYMMVMVLTSTDQCTHTDLLSSSCMVGQVCQQPRDGVWIQVSTYGLFPCRL